MAVPRSEEMQLVGYVLARCGITKQEGKPARPPEWLGAATWRETYALFHDALGDGRSRDSFANSLKNIRDAFDAHVPSGRVGWQSPEGKNPKDGTMVGTVLGNWAHRTDHELRKAVEDILAGTVADQVDEPEEASVRTEGGVKLRTIRQYERSRESRKQAIAIHGLSCMGCDFDFSERYGSLGYGYIEVHHSMPLGEHGIRDTDPATDLMVLCANCHRMMHRRKGICLSLDELKAKIAARI